MSAESIQEAFLFLNVEDVNQLPLQQQWALCIHAYNLYKGFKLTGFMEDDPRQEQIVQLPADWPQANADVVSFRYETENHEQFFKIIKTKNDEIEINCYQSKKEGNDDLAKLLSCTFKMEVLAPAKFDNLDEWLKRHPSMLRYEQKILKKINIPAGKP